MKKKLEDLSHIYIIGIDPGPNIGIGIIGYDKARHTVFTYHSQTYQDPQLIVPILDGTFYDLFCLDRMYAVETYVPGMTVTKDQIDTIKCLGFIQGMLDLHRQTYEMQQPQVRKPYLEMATKLLPTVGRTTHSKDSLAHAIRKLYRFGVDVSTATFTNQRHF